MDFSDVSPRTYNLAGLRIVSDFSLSGLVNGGDSKVGDVVTIRHAAERVLNPGPSYGDASYDGKATLQLTIPEVAHYVVSEGTEILVHPEPHAHPSDIRAYLLGSAFGSLCHQRGIMPLHSAAIDVGDGCVAFMGDSGAGKSTIAASLALRGYQVIADDVAFLRRDEREGILAWPGIGRIRLWQDSAAALGFTEPGMEREFRGFEKYLIPILPPLDYLAPRRLCGIYYLKFGSSVRTEVNRIGGASAMDLLMQNVYRADLADRMGYTSAIFALCASIANQVPVFTFSRPQGFAVLGKGIDLLEAHLRDVL